MVKGYCFGASGCGFESGVIVYRGAVAGGRGRVGAVRCRAASERASAAQRSAAQLGLGTSFFYFVGKFLVGNFFLIGKFWSNFSQNLGYFSQDVFASKRPGTARNCLSSHCQGMEFPIAIKAPTRIQRI